MSAALRLQLMVLARKNRFSKESDLGDLTGLRCHHRAREQAWCRPYRADLASGPGSDEIVQSFATEKYLLDELDRKVRDEFDEHLVDCQVCAFDVWAGATFLTLLGCRRWR
jgi:hypothetical protein